MKQKTHHPKAKFSCLHLISDFPWALYLVSELELSISSSCTSGKTIFQERIYKNHLFSQCKIISQIMTIPQDSISQSVFLGTMNRWSVRESILVETYLHIRESEKSWSLRKKEKGSCLLLVNIVEIFLSFFCILIFFYN